MALTGGARSQMYGGLMGASRSTPTRCCRDAWRPSGVGPAPAGAARGSFPGRDVRRDFAARHPDHVRGVVLLESPLRFGAAAGAFAPLVAAAPRAGLLGGVAGVVPGSLLNGGSTLAAPVTFHADREADLWPVFRAARRWRRICACTAGTWTSSGSRGPCSRTSSSAWIATMSSCADASSSAAGACPRATSGRHCSTSSTRRVASSRRRRWSRPRRGAERRQAAAVVSRRPRRRPPARRPARRRQRPSPPLAADGRLDRRGPRRRRRPLIWTDAVGVRDLEQ
jgi:hypothetical protein